MTTFTCRLCDGPATRTAVVAEREWYRMECRGIEGTHYHASGRALMRLEQAARDHDRRFLSTLSGEIAALSREKLVAWIDVDDTGNLSIEAKP